VTVIVEVSSLLVFLIFLIVPGVVVLHWKRSRVRPAKQSRNQRHRTGRYCSLRAPK
jgi:hypothetical protein